MKKEKTVKNAKYSLIYGKIKYQIFVENKVMCRRNVIGPCLLFSIVVEIEIHKRGREKNRIIFRFQQTIYGKLKSISTTQKICGNVVENHLCPCGKLHESHFCVLNQKYP